MSAHTPGPWTFSEHGGCWYVFGPGAAMVADSGEVARIRGVGRGATDDEQRANARLIAAAPQLLDALRGMLTFEDTGTWTADEEDAAIATARHAIAQAIGHYPIEYRK